MVDGEVDVFIWDNGSENFGVCNSARKSVHEGCLMVKIIHSLELDY